MGGFDSTRELEQSLQLADGEHITQVMTYMQYHNMPDVNRSYYPAGIIVGKRFDTDDNRTQLLDHAIATEKTEKYENYVVGCAQGKYGAYIDSLRFIWYKYTSKNSPICQ
jgi:hypothetical protein